MLVTQFLGVSKIQQSKVLSTMGDSHWTILIHLNLKKIKLNLLNVTMENVFLFLLSLRNKIILQHFFLLNDIRVVSITLEGAPKWYFDILF